MDKYEQVSVVGEGSYGVVMKCRHRDTDQLVAVKKFLETEEDATIRRMALREIRMLKRLKHENLVTMIEVFRHRKRFYLVFEFLEGTVLDELEKMPGGLGEERTRERIFQVVRAIGYCHGNNIIHRDVKPENVLVSSQGVVKLCDFGFARSVNLSGEACTEYVATRWYRAPELLVGEPVYSSPVDVWAIGCLFAEMMTGDPLFPGESDIDQLYLIVKMLGKPCARHQQLMSKSTQLRPIIRSSTSSGESSTNLYKAFPSWHPQAVEFLIGCTRMDPQDRATADELLRHPYFVHDKFPQRFLPALREKVNAEFNAPLLRKLRSEILLSTDKRDECRPRRSSNEGRWRTGEGASTKRKLNCEQYETDKNVITLAKSSQRLNVVNGKGTQHQQVLSKQTAQPAQTSKIKTSFKLPPHTEIQLLEKSLGSLARINTNDENRPISARNGKDPRTTPLLPDSPSPAPFQSLHYFGLNDYGRSPRAHAAVLHPSISNISFNRELPKKSPNVLHSLNNASKQTQVPLLSNPRSQFVKKLERNVMTENIFGSEDPVNFGGNPTTWLSGYAYNSQKKRELPKHAKPDDFSLPSLTGVSGSPNKNKKKDVTDFELPISTEVSPRVESATSQNSPTI
ncbi:cyclin-dependent kinase-like 1 isoform X2 [Cylas formicarius]|uniref:cyclin-dependent kinase-like 1 isoform X2 n=1 Tax=Cylas formicarius TaxID=197179 RepID=UPI0029588B76|nr:cyclin-dependent kinase-like 1 isoform X2 [Cylas formicarius]